MIRIRINPDWEHSKKIIAAIEKKNGHCPCRIDVSPSTVCMCEDFMKLMQEANSGHCHCNLFQFERE